jgi:hypothetical protein
MSGEAVIVGIRSACEGRTAVALVSGDNPQTLAHALELGAERAFTKPVDWEAPLLYLSSKREAAIRPNRSAHGPEKSMTVPPRIATILATQRAHDLVASVLTVEEPGV